MSYARPVPRRKNQKEKKFKANPDTASDAKYSSTEASTSANMHGEKRKMTKGNASCAKMSKTVPNVAASIPYEPSDLILKSATSAHPRKVLTTAVHAIKEKPARTSQLPWAVELENADVAINVGKT